MKLLFSETHSDYARYLYPYVIWAVPEGGETPADLMRHGFLPASPQMDRFYLCRNLRVVLRQYQPSSENRRVLRKGSGILATLVPRAEFDYSEARREAWKAYADQRFGDEVMSRERLDTLMRSPVISHLLVFRDAAEAREVGTALLYVQKPELAYYYYAFYDLGYLQRNLGMFMMTWAVGHFAEAGFGHLHLGTCYSERALYKTQFDGIEFFNGSAWSANLEELRFLIDRDQEQRGRHLLDLPEYLETFHGGRLQELADRSRFTTQ